VADQRAFTVAIDGPAAAGKGTISREIAAHFGFAYLDTGLLYRAVGARHLAGEPALQAAQSLTADDLANPDALRRRDIAQAASRIAVMPEIRMVLGEFQKTFARKPGGTILDGRDIGTVICPDAEVKLFVTASPEIRAERRFKELRARGHDSGQDTTFETVLADVLARDARDRDRATAPMVAAKDAIVLDTSTMSIKDAVQAAIDIVQKVRAGRDHNA
jgi:cytidylate kinase